MENIAYLREWQKIFSGDGLAFEYYFWRDHWNDPGYYEMGKVLLEDIKKLKDIGLHGMHGNQTTRVYMPSGFPMYLMGQALFDSSITFNDMVNYYFEKAFGEDWKQCLDYMAELSLLFNPVYIRDRVWLNPNSDAENKAAIERFKKIAPLVEKFKPVIEKNLSCQIRTIARSWQYLVFHAGLVIRLADALMVNAQGNLEQGRKLWEETMDYASRGEDSVQDAFDLYTFALFKNKFEET